MSSDQKESSGGVKGLGIPAVVFGGSGEEGRAVVEGLVEAGFNPVYAFTRQTSNKYLTDALGATLFTGNGENPEDVRQVLSSTSAQCIYLITTTDLVASESLGKPGSGFADAAAAEYEVMVELAQILVDVHRLDPTTPRHLIASVRDDVQSVNREIRETTGEFWIQPLDDGSVVPHYSAKGKGGKAILEFINKEAPDIKVTLLTMPFFYSNFLGFFCPLPDETKTQWSLTACLGDGKQKIDMMGARDLKTIVPKIFLNGKKFQGQNIRLVGEQKSMDDVAADFADLFGKDVIYNPLTYQEMASLPFPSAPAMAQMCQFLAKPQSTPKDLEFCQKLLYPKHPQTFQDWLLVHSDSKAFEQVGLDHDATEITSVTVFGATSMEGVSVIRGLLADVRKQYRIRATTRRIDSPEAMALLALAPADATVSPIEIVYADYDDKESCAKAVHGFDAAFLVTQLGHKGNQVIAVEERHVHNIIDACDASNSIRHLILASMMPTSDPKHHPHHIWNDEGVVKDDTNIELPLDAKAMAVAYARTKKISVTYISLPYTSDLRDEVEGCRRRTARDGIIASVCVGELGPIVANILDSYQVYAGHELALVTELVTVSDPLKNGRDRDAQVTGTYLKDLGPMFTDLAHSEVVKNREPIAQTLKLVPSSRPLKEWVEQHEEDTSFREKLGLR